MSAEHKLAAAGRCLALACLLLAGAGTRAAAQFRYDQWTVDDGVPHKSVRDVLQSRDGYLWLATWDGLARFDGLRFRVFNTGTAKGIKSNRLNSLAEDDEGNLWIGTGDESGVIRYRDGAFTTLAAADGLPSDRVLDVAADPAGGVLILTGKGVVKWRQGRLTPDPRQPPAIHETSRLYFDRRGALWINDEAGLHCFTAAGQRRTLTEKDGLSSRYTECVYQDRRGDYWVSTRAGPAKFTAPMGLNRLHDGRVTVYTQAEGLPNAKAWTMCEDPRGNLWIGTGHNVVCWQGGRFLSGEAAGIPDYPTWALAMICDREGSVWVASNERGLLRVRPKLMTSYTEDQGLPSNNVYPLLKGRDGGVWIGTWNGLSRYRDGALIGYEKPVPGQDFMITALAEDRAGGLLIGSYGGTFRFQAGRYTRWPEGWEKMPQGVVHAIHEDRAGNVWVGAEGWLGRYRDGAFEYYRRADGMPNDNTKFILEARDGALWFGTNGGLARLQNGVLTAWTERDGLSGNHIRCLYEDEAGALWIGTSDAGLTRFKDGRFTAVTVRDGLHDQGVFALLDDAQGNFWISCNRGIYRVSRRELNEFAEGRLRRVSSTVFGKKDGMPDIECNGGSQPPAVRTEDGRLWFPTQKGVVALDPAALPPAVPPPAAIEACLLDREPVAHQNGVRVSPDNDSLEIQFTSVNFSFPDQVRFRYQMSGLDKDWVEAGARRRVSYNHLPPGDYTFRVSAAVPGGEWSQEAAALRVVVVPPFWRTWWFLTLAAVGLGGAVTAGVKRRFEHLHRARAAQEHFSQQLLASQEQERKRIAAELHDSLNQTLVIIKNRALLGLKTPDHHDRAREQLGEIAEAAAQAIEEAREIAYALRPYHLDRLGLTKAVAELLDRIADAHGLKITGALDDIDGTFAPEAEINLYRIVQEGLNNIVRHAQATAASVKISRQADAVELTIQDNGRGFAPGEGRAGGERRGGFGLVGLAERARMLGGQMAVQSAPGQGTTISVRLPVKGAAP
jgi:signal transduction histidine kinase/ligand-binding sensor domain-containing protein